MVLLCLGATRMAAQVTGRIEYQRHEDYEAWKVCPIEEQGLIVYSFAKDSKKGKRYFKLELYSTDMKPLFTDSVLVDKDMYYSNFTYENHKAYYVLREKGGTFVVVGFDPKTRKVSLTDSEYTRKGSMRDITIMDGTMVFSSTQKKLDRLGIVNLATGKGHFVDMHFEGMKDKYVYILENTIIDGTVYAMVRVGRDIHLLRLDLEGNLFGETNLTSNVEETILSMSISKAANRLFATGTYTKARKGGSQGIYFAQLDNWQFKNLKFYNYLNLKNFTEFMSKRGQAKIERKKAKAARNGEEYALKYTMATHPIMTDGKDYFFLGEAYYPTYYTTMIGNTWVTQFGGYDYTHAVLAKFDEQSNLLWDSCFPMNPGTLPMYVKLFVSAGFKNNNVDLVYADGKKLMSKLFKNSDGSVIQDEKSEIQETDNEEDKVKKARGAETQHWYGNNFVVYATQVIKNQETKDRRKVFAITKYTIK